VFRKTEFVTLLKKYVVKKKSGKSFGGGKKSQGKVMVGVKKVREKIGWENFGHPPKNDFFSPPIRYISS